MALFLHERSSASVGHETDLFSVPPTKVSHESGSYVPHQPITTLTAERSPIEFYINGSTDEYIDLSRTYLHLKVKIVKPNGTSFTNGENVTFCNQPLHSLFSQVDILLNEFQCQTSNNLYPYRAYLESVLSFTKSAKESYLTGEGYYEDTPGHFENVKNTKVVPGVGTAPATTQEVNEGYVTRYNKTKNSKELELSGKIRLDLCNQDRLIPNGLDIRIRLTRSKDEFVLIGEKEAKVVIDDATLMVRKVKLNPNLIEAHERKLETERAKLITKKTEMKYLVIPSLVTSVNRDNLILGTLPNRLILGMVSTKSFQGSFDSNPFNFHHFGISTLSLFVDGVQLPSKPYHLDFPNGRCLRPYYDLNQNLDLLESEKGNGINRDAYQNGFTFFGFDLTADQYQDETFHILRKGNLRLEMQFSHALTESVVVIMFMEFDGVLEVNKEREIFGQND